MELLQRAEEMDFLDLYCGQVPLGGSLEKCSSRLKIGNVQLCVLWINVNVGS